MNKSTGVFDINLQILETTVSIYSFIEHAGYYKTAGFWTPSGDHAYVGGILFSNTSSHPHFGSFTNPFAVNSTYAVTAGADPCKYLKLRIVIKFSNLFRYSIKF